MPGSGVGWGPGPVSPTHGASSRSLRRRGLSENVRGQCAWRAELLERPWIPSWDHVCAPRDGPARSLRVRPDMR